MRIRPGGCCASSNAPGISTIRSAAPLCRRAGDHPPPVPQHAALLTRRDEARKAIARLKDQVEPVRAKACRAGSLRRRPCVTPSGRPAVRGTSTIARQARAAWAVRKEAGAPSPRLPGWSRTLDDLEGLAVPLARPVDRFETALHASVTTVKALDEKQAAEGEAISRLDARCRPWTSNGTFRPRRPPRRSRTPRRRLESDSFGLARRDGEVIAAGPPISRRRSSSQAGVDALADRLRREADRVTRKTEWLSQLDRHRASHAALRPRTVTRRPHG